MLNETGDPVLVGLPTDGLGCGRRKQGHFSIGGEGIRRVERRGVDGRRRFSAERKEQHLIGAELSVLSGELECFTCGGFLHDLEAIRFGHVHGRPAALAP